MDSVRRRQLSITEKLLVSQAVIEKGTADWQIISRLVADHSYVASERKGFFSRRVGFRAPLSKFIIERVLRTELRINLR
jgi:hypothetical protein